MNTGQYSKYILITFNTAPGTISQNRYNILRWRSRWSNKVPNRRWHKV